MGFKSKDPPKCDDPKAKKGDKCICPRYGHITRKGSGGRKK